MIGHDSVDSTVVGHPLPLPSPFTSLPQLVTSEPPKLTDRRPFSDGTGYDGTNYYNRDVGKIRWSMFLVLLKRREKVLLLFEHF